MQGEGADARLPSAGGRRISKDLLPLDGLAWPRRCCGREKGREARGQSEQRFGRDKTSKAETSKGKARNLCEHATNSKHDEETR